jgi:DNA invertase Pin-like site-specific DNA recombinase
MKNVKTDNSMNFGFARVSKNDQSLDRQLDALKLEQCDEIIIEKKSGRKQQTKLNELLSKMRTGDRLTVKSIDRLGRTAKELIGLLDHFKVKGIEFISIDERIDTTTIMGEAMFKIISILKEMEVSILSERTKDGLAAARARGRKGGRPKGSYNEQTANGVAHLYNIGKPVSEIMEAYNISRSTVYDHLRRKDVKFHSKKNV